MEEVEKIDEELFRFFYDKYYPKVYKAVYMIVGDQAQDITQEAFAILYNAPPKNMDNVGAWVTKVALNLAKNHLRQDTARRKREENSLAAKDYRQDPEERALLEIEKEKVRKTLNLLSKRDKEALVLKYSGYSYEEIAKTLKLNKSSVGTIIARAQKNFKSIFEGGE